MLYQTKCYNNKKRQSLQDCLLKTVPRTGIEPALPFENKILSLARLPIPPSGLARGCNINDLYLIKKTFFIDKFI